MIDVIKSAESMAMERTTLGMKYKIWRYNIKDNPYRAHKRNSVIWHNAFYDKCKDLGRNA